MLDKLRILKNQYEQLQRRMEEPETYSNPALYARAANVRRGSLRRSSRRTVSMSELRRTCARRSS